MTKNPIHISADLSLPLDVCTQALALLGMRGVGKTHTLTVLCEELIGAGAPVAILDPLGVLWGLRSSKDGKKPGLSVVVMGGEHGDVPLEPTSGRVIADWLVAERHPCVLDLSGFRKAEQRRFVTDFGVRLYDANREPLHLVVDEADLFAPQRPRPDEMAMLGCFEDLVRRGRARGIGISLATQRPAVIHKDVLTQVGVLIALRVVGPQDRKAIEDWIEYHGTVEERKAVLGSLGSLPIGTAYFWSPGWLGMLKKVRVRDRQTFDSSATPKLGSKRVTPQQLAPVDIEALRTRIADTIERAEADDPAVLRARIAELEQQLKTEQGAHDMTKAAFEAFVETPPAAEPERVEVPVFDAEAFETTRGRIHEHLLSVRGELDQYGIAMLQRAKGLGSGSAVVHRDTKLAKPQAPQVDEIAPVPLPRRPALTNGAGAKVSGGELAILTAVAQHRAGCTREQLTVLTGYKRSSRDTFIQRLSAAGRIDKDGDRLVVTDRGRADLGPDFKPLPKGAGLREFWLNKLGGGERVILEQLVKAYPKALTRTELSERTEYQRSSRDTFLQRLTARRLIESKGGSVVASAELF